MLPTPQFDFRRTPVTLIVTGLALALEIVSTISPEGTNWRWALRYEYRLAISPAIWLGDWWQPLTTTMLHANLLHAAFNIYWMFVMGPVVEERLGSPRYLALLLLLAYTSSMLDYLFTAVGGVGLSGVVYGLFGLMWVGRRYQAYWGAIINDDTVRLFMVWFFFCIVATYLGWMPVANVAHGAGLLIGALVGLAMFQPRRRALWSGLVALCVAPVALSLYAAPWHSGYRSAMAYREEVRRYEAAKAALEQFEREQGAHLAPATTNAVE